MEYEYDSQIISPRNASCQQCNGNASVHFATTLLTVNCQLSTVNWIYTFSAKEKDSETGLSYFGSRYYSSDLSIWLSVDPMSDKYPSLSPYVYCANNSVKLVDPNGEEIDWVEKADGTIYWDENATSKETTKHGETYLGKEGQHTIGTDVWNYHSDGTCDELRPIIVGTDDNSLIPSNNNTKKSNIDNANNILSNIDLVTSLPIAAAAESVVKTSLDFLCLFATRFVYTSSIMP